jgi:hypothetical protein
VTKVGSQGCAVGYYYKYAGRRFVTAAIQSPEVAMVKGQMRRSTSYKSQYGKKR